MFNLAQFPNRILAIANLTNAKIRLYGVSLANLNQLVLEGGQFEIVMSAANPNDVAKLQTIALNPTPYGTTNVALTRNNAAAVSELFEIPTTETVSPINGSTLNTSVTLHVFGSANPVANLTNAAFLQFVGTCQNRVTGPLNMDSVASDAECASLGNNVFGYVQDTGKIFQISSTQVSGSSTGIGRLAQLLSSTQAQQNKMQTNLQTLQQQLDDFKRQFNSSN